MKDLFVRVIGGEAWLTCDDHGVIRCFGTYANLSDIVAAENEHATIHLLEVHDLTTKKGS